VGFTI